MHTTTRTNKRPLFEPHVLMISAAARHLLPPALLAQLLAFHTHGRFGKVTLKDALHNLQVARSKSSFVYSKFPLFDETSSFIVVITVFLPAHYTRFSLSGECDPIGSANRKEQLTLL